MHLEFKSDLIVIKSYQFSSYDVT